MMKKRLLSVLLVLLLVLSYSPIHGLNTTEKLPFIRN